MGTSGAAAAEAPFSFFLFFFLRLWQPHSCRAPPRCVASAALPLIPRPPKLLPLRRSPEGHLPGPAEGVPPPRCPPLSRPDHHPLPRLGPAQRPLPLTGEPHLRPAEDVSVPVCECGVVSVTAVPPGPRAHFLPPRCAEDPLCSQLGAACPAIEQLRERRLTPTCPAMGRRPRVCRRAS